MGLEFGNIDCKLTCDVCKKEIPLEQKIVKLTIEKDKVQIGVADVTVRLIPVVQGDDSCEVATINCAERALLCPSCAKVYRDRKESLLSAYNENNKTKNLLQFVKEQF
jgi:hypothetical protein